MIENIKIQNFKCLRDVDVELRPFTVLIGPNDSGKTSFLDAIKRLGETTAEPLSSVFSGSSSFQDIVWRRTPGLAITWTVHGTRGGQRIEYRLEIESAEQPPRREYLAINQQAIFNKHRVSPLNPSGRRADYTVQNWQDQELPVEGGATGVLTMLRHGSNFANRQPMTEIVNALDLLMADIRTDAPFRFDPNVMRKPATPSREAKLLPTGEKLVAVLDQVLTAADRQPIIRLESDLHNMIPTLRGINLEAEQNGVKQLRLTLSGNESRPITIPAAQASDGAILLLGFLAFAYGTSHELLLIEEPENGLHYSRLEFVINILRKMSTGEIGDKPRQVIVTTHSPILLNCVKPEEVRVFNRGEDGETKIVPLDKVENAKALLNEFSPGELWYLLGEEKLAAGVAL